MNQPNERVVQIGLTLLIAILLIAASFEYWVLSESPEAKRIDFIIKNAKSFIILDSVFIYENIENDKYFMGIFEKQKTIWSESKKK